MKTRTKVLIITLLFGIPAFFLGKILWSPAPDLHPTSAQLPFFILLSLIEALLFGLGIAFMIFAWPAVQKVGKQYRKRAIMSYLAVAWFLLSWWPHDNLHAHNGMDTGGLLLIEYAFHVTLIIAAVMLSYSFYTMPAEKIK